ncbi:translocation/assembly module TamB domain-containing protein [Acidovorax sp. JG5]|uniref:translocation/assembly module TamB domain-containing protein n=1 Tax=Acidovorax sp. JG5 TaxID=2822718 RepID=UPI001B33DD5D|nr:translocation/assembly module TamB domain-containing protein [Acidovorax sp. JG5]MBP3980148.1 translocation/assembly module TamB domain-containing protein [Acidovorax sp. JG5]
MRRQPPAHRAPEADFSAGSAAPATASARGMHGQRARRALRFTGWLLVGLCALVLAAGTLAWWWSGRDNSLATLLARAAQYLPAGQTLDSREVSGSLRSGGRIGWLRWSSPTLRVEVSDARVGWQLAPLLQRRLELGEVHAATVTITPLGPPSTEPLTPLDTLVLPLQIGLPFRIDRLQWAGSPAVEALGLVGDYRFDGRQHHLTIGNVALAQGRYTARATLDAQAPMALDATVSGSVHQAVPGSSASVQVLAHATLKGTLSTAAARLQLDARLRPVAPDAPNAQAAEAATPPASTAPPAPAAKPAPARPRAPSTPASVPEPMQADLHATLAPWAPQPIEQARATLRAVNLATLWPQAPATLLHGTLQAGPTAAPAASGWALQAQIRNALAGPWDQSRLPLTALAASATWDGTRWSIPAATASVGQGTATVQGHYTPATGAIDGKAQLRNLPPEALHSALAAAPLSGSVVAQTEGGGNVAFTADIQANTATRSPGARGNPKPGTADQPRTQPAPALRINALQAKGQWQPQQGDGTVRLDRLRVDAMQARLEATALQVTLGTIAVQGQLQLTVPGASAQAKGALAPRTGAGELQVQWTDADRTQRWLTSLPGLATALHGATLKGQAQLASRWSGGWQSLAEQLQAARAGQALPTDKTPFTLQATLTAPQLDLTLPPGNSGKAAAATAVQLQSLQAELSGSLRQARLALDGKLRTGTLLATLHTRATGGLASAALWKAQVSALRVQAQDTTRPGPWTLELSEALALTAQLGPPPAAPGTSGMVVVQAAAGQARVSGPLPGSVTLQWQPVRYQSGPGTASRLQSQGRLQGLPFAWVDALGLEGAPAVAGQPAQPLLARLGLGGDMVLEGQWSVDAGATLRAQASLRRTGGDLRILTGETAPVTVLQSTGQGTGAGSPTAITAPEPGSRAGVRQAELTLEAEGEALRARLLWASDRAGEIDASASTRLTLGKTLADANGLAGATWAPDAPLAANVRARLPDMGVWSALAPPGWRVRGTLDANATLSGTRAAPRWAGTLGADGLAVRSIVDGVDLQNGQLRATLRGNQLDITEFRLQGGRGSNARIAGFSGNRTPAPQDGGTLTGSGRLGWGEPGAGMSGITMDITAEARALQVLVRADRQVSVSGQVQAQLQQGQFSLRGKLTTDRATIILPDESAPSLGSDVVVRSAAKDRADQAKAQAAGRANQKAAQAETARSPAVAITLNLGRDFALQGQGITTRLTGELDIRSSTVPGAPPRVTGEVRTDAGRYRAWGQVLDVETGLIRFNGPYNNPALDILALRPNISVRAGVQVTGSALAPRVRLYSDPELPDAEKLSWVVLGRDAANGGAEAAVLQQAALTLLGRGGGNPTAQVASRLGLDEIGFKGPGAGEDATSAALTFGKRLSKDMYVTYERSLSGTLGTLYIFYDLSRRLTLRGQTGEKSAVDIIYTVRYD